MGDLREAAWFDPNTSGWVMDRAMAGRLAECFDEVVVSVDGSTAEVHDRIRGRAGSFDRVMTAPGLLGRGSP
ncbi:radical SAM protein [Streptomyces cirratus]